LVGLTLWELDMSDPNRRTSADGTRVVILGGGFGGAYAARTLQKQERRLGLDVTLIDRNNYMLFYPLLVEAGTGSLEPRHAVVSLRAWVPDADFRMAEVTGIDLERREVQTAAGDGAQSLPYDHLLIALGSVTRLPPVEGLAEHGFQMKSMSDAVAMRDRAIEMLERANAIDDEAKRRELLTFVVVGANYTGVEVAGEFLVFLRRAAANYDHVEPNDIRIVLVELQDRILPALDQELADYAAEQLTARGVRLVLGDSVSKVAEDHVILKNEGERIAARTCIWAAGIQPSPLIEKLDLPTDERGYVVCDDDLRVRGFDHVWAIGDCAVNRDPKGEPYPPTAQHASQMGKAAAKNIVRCIEGRPTRPFVYRNKGTIAALGCRTAVAKVFGLKLSGFVAWWLYRTVYLLKMPGLGRRFRIALDWTADLFFERDYVQLNVHRFQQRQRDRAAGREAVHPAERETLEVR
jgi:NADH dehydrogenase